MLAYSDMGQGIWTTLAQIQGAVVFGLSAALYGKLTLEGGQVQESNFHDYPPLRMFEMPKIDVHIIQSGAHLDTSLVLWGCSAGFGRAPVSIARDQFLAAWDVWARVGAPCPEGPTASR